MLGNAPQSLRLVLVALFSCLLLGLYLQGKSSPQAYGQETPPANADATGPVPFEGDDNAPAAAESAPAPAPPAKTGPEDINILELLFSGGFYMIPLAVLSVLVVTFTIERIFGLRRSRILPPELIASLGKMAHAGGFDPRKAYRHCQEYPSATANVIRAMLLKVGRPHSEVEQTVNQTSQREADKLYANVRYLTMSASVAPLIGLLGTVWGMIIAFHDTTRLAPGQNKADFLAEGIYIALVTTLGGLCVAIPAAVAAHYFEGRIQGFFREIDELLFSLLPQVERYEGRVRFTGQGGEPEETPREAPPPPPPESRRPTVATPK